MYTGNALTIRYTTFIAAILGSKPIDTALGAIVGKALDWQWASYLGKELPEDYALELAGIADGAAAQGHHDVGEYPETTLTNPRAHLVPTSCPPVAEI